MKRGSFWLLVYPLSPNLTQIHVGLSQRLTVLLHTPPPDGSTGSIVGAGNCSGVPWERLFVGDSGSNTSGLTSDSKPTMKMVFTQEAVAEAVAIVAPKTTDVLRVRPATVSPGLLLDPLASAGIKAAYYSAAFILRFVAAEELDIDPDELDISNVRQIQLANGTRAGEIIINDHLANGAGFTAWIEGNLAKILGTATSVNAPRNTFIGALLSDDHRMRCDSSGYDCLQNYRNMAFHGLLDWRLGVSLLRSLQSPAFNCALDGVHSLPDLHGWFDLATTLRDSFCRSFNTTSRVFGPLPGLEVGGRQVIIVHPLWDMAKPAGLLAEAKLTCTQGEVRTLDTFNLLRRQGWAYRSLG